ncbi:MAG: histidine kinase dimerization/phospho-acceptor domain-containing protein [Eubacteriales bacterium]
MKEKKNFGKGLQKFFTVVFLSSTLLLGYFLAFSLNLDVYNSNSFEETGSFYDYGVQTVIINLYDYHHAEDRVTSSVTTTGPVTDGVEEEVDSSQKEMEIASYQESILLALESAYSVKNHNFQVKITDVVEKSVLLDTFGTGEYEFLSTNSYLDYEIIVGLQTPLTVQDGFPSLKNTYETLKEYADILPVALGICGILSLLNLCLLVKFAGKAKNKEELILTAWDKIPTDLLIFCSLSVLALGINAGMSTFHHIFYHTMSSFDDFTLQLLNIIAFFTAYVVVKFIETFAVRLKSKTLFQNTVVWKFFKLIIKSLQKLPIIWRTALISTIICAVNGILGMISMTSGFAWLVFALYNLAVLVFFCGLSWQMKLLQTGAETLVSGQFHEKIDTQKMYFDCKKYGETLNTIGDGIGLAVEEKMRSERMKTELITNVSHDIKTPLTSIVTCVELLQKEHTDEENTEYLQLLQRQSMRMKKLVEDLVEASKATTGNLSVSLVETNLVEVVSQALGEYEDRFQEKNLVLISQFPDDCKAQADGKHLWRVLDNLLSNVCKYAQSGTRVYVTVEKMAEKSGISIKNISAEPLNMSAEELMERFVRGDSSRSTEGSGLGLNIAQSLMQVQHGSLNLTIDGDLVKVELILQNIPIQ